VKARAVTRQKQLKAQAKRGIAFTRARVRRTEAEKHHGTADDSSSHQSMILLIGYSTIPVAPAALSRGTIMRT
jgi:hypothetical protein